jgi:CRISPR-associated protein Csm3
MSFFLFKGKYIIKAKLVCDTGLHIGGSTEGFEIGGMDNPVIKDILTDEPYIPGSSLKGKLRSLLEWSLGGPNNFNGEFYHFTFENRSGKPTFSPCSCGECVSCVLFGVTPEAGLKAKETSAVRGDTHALRKDVPNKTFLLTGPTRLIIRDGFLTDDPPIANNDYKKKNELKQLTEGLYTEVKTENALDRVTAESNPRPMERVPRGGAFDIEMIMDVYLPRDKELLRGLFKSMLLLEESALGGTGSRGSGKVHFTGLSLKFRPISYYETGDDSQERTVIGLQSLTQALKDFNNIDWEFPVFEG